MNVLKERVVVSVEVRGMVTASWRVLEDDEGNGWGQASTCMEIPDYHAVGVLLFAAAALAGDTNVAQQLASLIDQVVDEVDGGPKAAGTEKSAFEEAPF